MSVKVLVVPEDPTLNGYILKPLITRMMQAAGKPNAEIKVVNNPRPRGYADAKKLLIDVYLERYRHFDLFLFLPDADGKDRTAEFLKLEQTAHEKNVTLFCCAAQQEVEVWLLAGHAKKLKSNWEDVRSDVSVKENVFESFLNEIGDRRRPGGGRDLLMDETLKQYQTLLKRCPELKELQDRLKAFVKTK